MEPDSDKVPAGRRLNHLLCRLQPSRPGRLNQFIPDDHRRLTEVPARTLPRRE